MVAGVGRWPAVALVATVGQWAAQCWAERSGHRGLEDGAEASDGCRFPAGWHGAYFLGGSREPFNVGEQHFGTGSFCYRKHAGNKFTVYNRADKCFHCIQVCDNPHCF
jgi:hypothetical protein